MTTTLNKNKKTMHSLNATNTLRQLDKTFEHYRNIAYYFKHETNSGKIFIVLDCCQAIVEQKLIQFFDDLSQIRLKAQEIEVALVPEKTLQNINSNSDCKNRLDLGQLQILVKFALTTHDKTFHTTFANCIAKFLVEHAPHLAEIYAKEYLRTARKSLSYRDIGLQLSHVKKHANDNRNNVASLEFKKTKLPLPNPDKNLLTNTEPFSNQQTLNKTEQKIFPLSDGQLRLAYLEESNPTFSPYNWLMAFEIEGEVNATVLENCLRTLIKRHESLRTGIDQINSTQIILEPTSANSWNLQLLKTDQSIKEVCHKFTQQKFNLAKPPLIRSALVSTQRVAAKQYWLCVIHHVVFDGISQKIFLRELSGLYSRALNDPAFNLDEQHLPQSQFRDYLLWFNQIDKKQQIEFWKEELKDVEMLTLPTDFSRQQKTFAGERHAIHISNEIKNDLLQLANQNKVTLYTCLLAAFQTFLHKYSQQNDICTGTMTANRKKHGEIRRHLESIIGFLATNIVIRTKFNNSLNVATLIKDVGSTIQKAVYHNSDVTFSDMVKAANTSSDGSRNPLFETMFVFQDRDYQTLQLADHCIKPIESGWGISPFELTLELRECEHGLVGFFDYNSNLFTADTIQRMADNFVTLLQDFATNPHKSISDLTIIHPTEYKLISSWMKKPSDTPVYLPMHRVIETIKNQSPNSPAVIYENLPPCSFSELDNNANQFANFLISKQNIKPGDLVAICIKRSIELVVAILAVWKAGGVVICLETKQAERVKIDQKLNLSAPQKIITHRATADLIPPKFQNQMVLYEDIRREHFAGNFNFNPPDVNVCANDLAMIAFTSGSENGIPKPIKIRHAGLHNWIVFYQEYGHKFGIRPNINVYLSLDMAFDGGICEMFCQTLGHGSTLCINSEDNQFNPQALKEFFTKNNIELAELTPTLLSLFKPEHLPTLKYIFVVGEAFKKNVIAEWLKAGVVVVNGYGPSEATIGVTLYICSLDAPIYIGKPISNMRVYILDENRRPVPIGVWGELYISGVGIADGYLNLPQDTKAAFLKDPFWPGDSMYKTGDLGRFAPDGNIEFKGRIKGSTQIKLFGVRIELSEIEHHLLAHPDISKAVVTSVGELDKQSIVAFIVTKSGNILAPATVKQFLTERGVWTIKIPSVIVNLPSLPATTNGKLNMKLLASYALKEKEKQTKIKSEAKTETQKKVLEIWQHELELENIGVDDYFNEIGGQSIQKIKIINSVNALFFPEPLASQLDNSDSRVSLTDLNGDFTIEQLAALIDKKKNPLKQNQPDEQSDDNFENPYSWFSA